AAVRRGLAWERAAVRTDETRRRRVARAPPLTRGRSAARHSHTPIVGSQASVPASLTAKQSGALLHSTEVPATVGVVVSPRTCAAGSLPVGRGVPVGGGV